MYDVSEPICLLCNYAAIDNVLYHRRCMFSSVQNILGAVSTTIHSKP